jgi:hypothetical protein
MNRRSSVVTTVCDDYQALLEECQRALADWNELRANVREKNLVTKESGDQLLRLQAGYARAYTVLQNHARLCFRCRLASRMAEPDTEKALTH